MKLYDFSWNLFGKEDNILDFFFKKIIFVIGQKSTKQVQKRSFFKYIIIYHLKGNLT